MQVNPPDEKARFSASATFLTIPAKPPQFDHPEVATA
jgi:hypothetical protein